MRSAMEQTRYWMWTRKKIGGRPLDNTVAAGSSCESWEEQAFAEDSAGRLGGCIWPPSSYTCSFCRREFRSAQALGGHMNVHRRDRARLKQSPNAISENHDDHSHHQIGLQEPLGGQPHLCPVMYNPNPRSNKNLGVAASPLPASRVSAVISQQEIRKEGTLIPRAYSSYIIREDVRENQKESLPSCSNPLADSIAVRELTVAELKLGRDTWRLREVGCRRERDTSEDNKEVPSSKRKRTEPVIPFFSRPASANEEILQSEAFRVGPSPVEELDLELRLGDRPTVR